MNTLKLMVLVWCACLVSAANAQIIDVPFKDEVATRTLLVPTKHPQAVVLLFIGGHGMLKLKDDGSTNNTHTFTRSKDLWAQYGIDAVLVDTPYSLGKGGGMASDLRPLKDHQQRIFKVVQAYKEKLNVPVWLFGHSRGTVSVSEFVNSGATQDKLVAGVIIAGTLNTVSIDDDVQSPIIAIHHKQDGCHVTPFSVSENIIERRPDTTTSKLVPIEGGISEGNACGNTAYHGFNRREPELIHAAAEFILSNP
jgi:hypothetical protein